MRVQELKFFIKKVSRLLYGHSSLVLGMRKCLVITPGVVGGTLPDDLTPRPSPAPGAPPPHHHHHKWRELCVFGQLQLPRGNPMTNVPSSFVPCSVREFRITGKEGAFCIWRVCNRKCGAAFSVHRGGGRRKKRPAFSAASSAPRRTGTIVDTGWWITLAPLVPICTGGARCYTRTRASESSC